MLVAGWNTSFGTKLNPGEKLKSLWTLVWFRSPVDRLNGRPAHCLWYQCSSTHFSLTDWQMTLPDINCCFSKDLLTWGEFTVRWLFYLRSFLSRACCRAVHESVIIFCRVESVISYTFKSRYLIWFIAIYTFFPSSRQLFCMCLDPSYSQRFRFSSSSNTYERLLLRLHPNGHPPDHQRPFWQ